MSQQHHELGSNPGIIIELCEGDLVIEGNDNNSITYHIDEHLETDIHENVIRFKHIDDLRISVPRGSMIDIHKVEGDLKVSSVDSVVVHNAYGDAHFADLGSLSVSEVHGDIVVNNIQSIEIKKGQGDIKVEHSEITRIENVGGDLSIRDVIELEIDNVGGDFNARDLRGPVGIKNVGGDMRLRGAVMRLSSVRVGGDLELDTTWAADNDYRATVGGDAILVATSDTNMILSATVGGDVVGLGSRKQGVFSTVLGSEETAARVELTIGGDLRIRGLDGSSYRERSSEGVWGNFDGDVSGFFQGIADEFKTIGRDIADQFSNSGWSEVIDRQAERARHKAEQAAKRAASDVEKIRIRFNDKEFSLDPERIERIREQAQRAVEEGITHAKEAIERALGSLGDFAEGNAPRPPAAPQAPQPPQAPQAPQRFQVSDDDGSGTINKVEAATGQTIRMDKAETSEQPTEAAPQDLTQERLAILRMVEAGKISADEASMLLEALR